MTFYFFFYLIINIFCIINKKFTHELNNLIFLITLFSLTIFVGFSHYLSADWSNYYIYRWELVNIENYSKISSEFFIPFLSFIFFYSYIPVELTNFFLTVFIFYVFYELFKDSFNKLIPILFLFFIYIIIFSNRFFTTSSCYIFIIFCSLYFKTSFTH